MKDTESATNHHNVLNKDFIRHVSQHIPRIQLCVQDRESKLHCDARHAQHLDGRASQGGEKYVQLWNERVMACGVAAMSRIPPLLAKLRALQGELVMEKTSYVKVCETQPIIVCLSDKAIYFIISKLNRKQRQKRLATTATSQKKTSFSDEASVTTM